MKYSQTVNSILMLPGDENCLSGPYLANLKESGIAAQIAKPWQQQILHCVFTQHGNNFTHDLLEEICGDLLYMKYRQHIFTRMQNHCKYPFEQLLSHAKDKNARLKTDSL